MSVDLSVIMQDLEKNGLNLNPMFFWQYVMSGSLNRTPRIVVKGSISYELAERTKDLPVDLIIEDGPIMEGLTGVTYRERKKMLYKDWVEGWARTDFLVCDECKKDYWLQAGLCGVKVIFSDDDWKNEPIRVLTYAERVNNWEQTKSILTM